MGRPYDERLVAERGVYDQCLQVHDLPRIFHYWSNRYVRPMFRSFGFDDLKDIFKNYLEDQCSLHPIQPTNIISIGSGNCDFEIELVSHLRARGHRNFVLECLDLNSSMLERGRAASQQAGIIGNMSFVQGDFNQWTADREYDAVIANQSLHHVLRLEHLFAQIRQSLAPDGTFIISDMIGRNGHQRWPEALEIVHEFWRDLPPSYRFNQSLHRYQELFKNWDCSLEGFEGIRSQDILPLLIDNFHFQLFLPFGNLIDPFIDRPFGFNFDADAQWDRAFIDRVQQRDRKEMSDGRLKPTHMLAVVIKHPHALPILIEPLTPAFCVRRPGEVSSTYNSNNAYNWGCWPHSAQTELETACRRLREGDDKIVELESEIQERTAWARGLETKLEDRTKWALQMEKELADRTKWAFRLEEENDQLKNLVPQLQNDLIDRTAWVRRLEVQVDERTAWAQHLDHDVARLETEVRQRTEWALNLETQLHDRTAWARQLETDYAEQSARATHLETELSTYIHNPFRYLIRLTRGIRNRFRSLASRGPRR